MISPPGLNSLVVNEMFIYGVKPSHNELEGYYGSSSLLWNNSSCSICFIISFYLFSLLSQGNTPSSVCVGISGPIPAAQGADKKRNSSLHLDGCGSQQTIHGFGQYDNSEKEATDILQQVPATDIPISCQAQSRDRRQRGKTNPEHQGPPHDLDGMSLWHSRLSLSASSSSPASSFLKATRFTHFLQEVFHDELWGTITDAQAKRSYSASFWMPFSKLHSMKALK